MKSLPLIFSILFAVSLCHCNTQPMLNAQEAAEYARYVKNNGAIATNLRSAANQAAKIAGEIKNVRTGKVTRIPMSAEEQATVRRLFAVVDAPPILAQEDWYEYRRYERNMIHPTPPLCFCDIVFLAADGTELASKSLFESPWTDVGDKKDTDSYRTFEDGSDTGDTINGRYIPNLIAEGELIRQFNQLPVMTKLKQMAADCYAGR